ncbi:MAG: hypothetical protein M3N51_07425 [Actinomycetota bacterium]|nr:hypothetical protein [Actinomycetota bacterium]
MDTKHDVDDLLERLRQVDPAKAPELADRIAAALGDELEERPAPAPGLAPMGSSGPHEGLPPREPET